MDLNLKKLNKEQREAVIHKEGPLLIVAGAGTGKTTVITQRITYLIEKKLAKPDEILAVTFTEKAAGEMEERVDKLLPYGYVDLWISTFHSFCERVLRDYALDIGIPADFKILDQTSSWLFIYKNLDKFNLDYYKTLGNPTKFIKALISHFSHCKDQGIYPEDYLEYAKKLETDNDELSEEQELDRIKEIALAYKTYQRLLLGNSFLDFGDLINYCLKLFKERPLILKKYREKFKYILVDEFQDTNFAQYELIKILATPRNNLTVTADDDQSVYKWRGASFSNIIQFKKDFPKAEQISLIKNYRSYQNILDLGHKFIEANNPDRLEFINKINKKLVADKKGEGIIEHIHTKTLQEEGVKVVNRIIEILNKDKDSTYDDFAILVRANSAADIFTKALERAGLPYQFLASKGLYSKPIIIDTISYFKVLDNYYESMAVYRILNMPFLEIDYNDLAKITQYSRYKTKPLHEVMEEIFLVSGISQKTQDKISFILNLIKKHSILSKEKTVSEVFLAFLQDSGYLKYLIDKGVKKEIDILNQFYKKIKSFEESNIDPSLRNFVEEVSLEIESGEEGSLKFDPEQGPEMIKVMTIHSAKGLEFKYVFLVNMVDKRFPTIGRKDLIELPEELIKDIKPKGDVHLQEERRICYVAMTRAKMNLYFTSAEDYGGTRKKKLSRFLAEMGYNSTEEEKEENDLLLKHSNVSDKKNNNSNLKLLPSHFSFSQLAAFEKCPLQYKFNFILKVPVKGKAVFSFGKTMHKTLHLFLKEASIRKKGDLPKMSYISKLYEENWVDEWYENKKQKEEYRKLGEEIIKNFYKDFLKNPPKILKIKDNLALEIPFNLKIGGNTLYGVIDRIDEIEGEAIIIDYKTGKAKEKLDSGDKEQLLIYQIAGEEVLGINIKGLSYHYLNENKKVSFLGSEKDKKKLKEKIIKEIEQIKKSNFDPTPGWQCKYCDFKDICDFANRK